MDCGISLLEKSIRLSPLVIYKIVVITLDSSSHIYFYFY